MSKPVVRWTVIRTDDANTGERIDSTPASRKAARARVVEIRSRGGSAVVRLLTQDQIDGAS